jgi:hypothetical protein
MIDLSLLEIHPSSSHCFLLMLIVSLSSDFKVKHNYLTSHLRPLFRKEEILILFNQMPLRRNEAAVHDHSQGTIIH